MIFLKYKVRNLEFLFWTTITISFCLRSFVTSFSQSMLLPSLTRLVLIVIVNQQSHNYKLCFAEQWHQHFSCIVFTRLTMDDWRVETKSTDQTNDSRMSVLLSLPALITATSVTLVSGNCGTPLALSETIFCWIITNMPNWHH